MSTNAITTPGAPTGRAARPLRWDGVSGLLATAAFLATGVLTSIVGEIEAPDDVADMSRYLADVGDVELGYVLYAVAGIALCVLYVPMSLAVTRVLNGGSTARFGTMSVIAGLVILLPAYVLAVASTTGLVNAQAAGAGADSLFAVREFSATASEVFFAAGSFLSLGVGPLLWGLAGRGGTGIPRWMSRLAIVVGTVGLVWAVPPSDNVLLTVLVLINVLGSLVLFAALSVKLLRAG